MGKHDTVIRNFESADETLTFDKGRFEIIRMGNAAIGRASYEPGWKWSMHIGVPTGQKSCQVEHVGFVLAGRVAVAMDDGEIVEMRAGDAFHVPPGHDSWVIGDEPYVSLHFMGAEHYARHG